MSSLKSPSREFRAIHPSVDALPPAESAKRYGLNASFALRVWIISGFLLDFGHRYSIGYHIDLLGLCQVHERVLVDWGNSLFWRIICRGNPMIQQGRRHRLNRFLGFDLRLLLRVECQAEYCQAEKPGDACKTDNLRDEFCRGGLTRAFVLHEQYLCLLSSNWESILQAR
ncbi:hypothetical protein ElP_44550 [Tautonia plasticadhaerens]|uniref:Uncharacterized protein n=1 Tax=Tautonia plasticadhaerens TaxID=2527974 RepID=A0A518H6N0_9BACT|nr:hypothetical protein ElP_44550 [Tautonia plasticadhaerens]